MADRDYDANRGYYNRGFYGSDYDRGYYNRGYSRYDQGDYGRGGSYGSNWGRGSGSYGGYNPGAYGGYGPDDYSSEQFNPDWDYIEWTSYYFVPGPFVGVGPENYRRSDQRILEDVADRLTFNGQINAANLTLSVDNGEVNLEGKVDSRQAKRLAERIAESVPGVRDVCNNLHVDKHLGEQLQRQLGSGFGANQFSEGGRGFTPRGQIQEGQAVTDSRGTQLGTIRDIRSNDFLLRRTAGSSFFVPFTAIQEIKNNQVQLNIAANDLERQGWPSAEPAQLQQASASHPGSSGRGSSSTTGSRT